MTATETAATTAAAATSASVLHAASDQRLTLSLNPWRLCRSMGSSRASCDESSPFVAPLVMGIATQLASALLSCLLVAGSRPVLPSMAWVEFFAVASSLASFACYLGLTVGSFCLANALTVATPIFDLDGGSAKWSFLVASTLQLLSFLVLWHLRGVRASVAPVAPAAH